jgi:hypothetical protein
MARINLLISRVMDDLHTANGRFTGVVISARDGYTPLALDDARRGGRPLSVSVRMSTRWDNDAINNVGRRGASVVDLDVSAVETAVAQMRAAWGDVPVQDNSGRFPHLATAPGVLRI